MHVKCHGIIIYAVDPSNRRADRIQMLVQYSEFIDLTIKTWGIYGIKVCQRLSPMKIYCLLWVASVISSGSPGKKCFLKSCYLPFTSASAHSIPFHIQTNIQPVLLWKCCWTQPRHMWMWFAKCIFVCVMAPSELCLLRCVCLCVCRICLLVC